MIIPADLPLPTSEIPGFREGLFLTMYGLPFFDDNSILVIFKIDQ